MRAFDIFIFAVNSVFPIVLVVMLGYYLKRTGLLTKEFLKVGNKLTFRFLIPALLFTNLIEMDDFSELNLSVILYVLGAMVIIVTSGALLALGVKDKKQKGVIWQCTFRSNYALIGVPLAQLMAGEEGVRCAALISAFSIPIFNIMAVIALSLFVDIDEAGDLTNQAVITPKMRIKKILKDILHNPLILSVVLGVLFVACKPIMTYAPESFMESLRQFSFVKTALGYLAKASTPVALLVLGGQFEFHVITKLKTQIVTGCMARLLLAPFIGIGGAVLLQNLGLVSFEPSVYAVFVSLFGTPVAVSSAVMAEEMQNDGQLAGQLVVWTTLLSTFSIFLMVIMLRTLGLL